MQKQIHLPKGRAMELIFKEAQEEHLEDIIRLLSDDELACKREQYTLPLPQCYKNAFSLIQNDSNSIMIIACLESEVVGYFQISFTQYLSHKGTLRATIENVRVESNKRNLGIGSKLMKHAIIIARQRGANMVQLMSEKSRVKAHNFYKKLGFVDSHIGMKLKL